MLLYIVYYGFSCDYDDDDDDDDEVFPKRIPKDLFAKELFWGVVDVVGRCHLVRKFTIWKMEKVRENALLHEHAWMMFETCWNEPPGYLDKQR